MSLISDNLQAVYKALSSAALEAGRSPAEITLLAVSKTFNAAAVIEAAHAGQTAFGENYLQEALDKMTQVRAQAPELSLEWHFIGPIQSNKTRPIAEHFAWAHSVDRLKIAERLSQQRPEGLPDLNLCLQINISGEASKSGVAPEQALELAQAIAALPRLRLRGLMAIPEPSPDPAQQHRPMQEMRVLFQQLQQAGLSLDTLSMGMSADMAIAIAEGSTMVRIGTAIFGGRQYAK
jgi:pyridoxal phosphate enzyme (YggS family)